MPRKRPEFLLQNETPGGAGCSRGCGWLLGLNVAVMLVALGASWLGDTLQGALMVLALLAGWALLPSAHRGALRAGVTTDSEGLTEWFPLGFRRRTRWLDVTSIATGSEFAVLSTDRHHVRLAPPLTDWLKLANRAQEACGLQPTVDHARDELLRLPPEVVASWLGVPVDGELRGTSQFHRQQQAALVGGLVLVALLGWLGLPLLVFGMSLPRRPRRVLELRATPAAIEVNTAAGWRTYSWGGLTRLSRRGPVWHVSTLDGDLLLPPMGPVRDQLLHAIRQAIEARQAGWTLPQRPTDVPETALSRLSGDAEVVAERGLSQAAEGPEE